MVEAAAPAHDAPPRSRRKKPIHTQLWFWVLVGIVVGITLGLVAPGFAKQLKILADLFIQLIKVLIAPVIFCTVIVGIASLGNLARAGGVALRALGYFLVATIVALFLGLLAGNIVQPGAGFQGHPSDAQIAAATASVKTGSQESGFGAFLQNELFPTSFLQPFVDNQVLQVLVLAILTACSITFLSAGMRRQAVAAIDGIAKVVFGIIKIVMWAAPLAALGGMAYTVAAFGAGSLVNLLKLMATFYATCAIFIVVVLGAVAAWAGFNVLKLIRLIKDELLIIVGTSSSETVLPRLLTKLESAGASRQTVGLVIPTGYSFNLDGTCIYLTLGALFIIQAGGEQLGIGPQIALATLMVLTSKGAAGVTGAGLVTLAASLQAFGGEFFTPDAIAVGIALIVGIDRMMSEGRALTNAIGNCVATLVIARWVGELDRERLRAVLDDPSLTDDDMELHHGDAPAEEASAAEPDDVADGRHSAAGEETREPAARA
jgi:aerobic C4-dicarboxylate transport protein